MRLAFRGIWSKILGRAENSFRLFPYCKPVHESTIDAMTRYSISTIREFETQLMYTPEGVREEQLLNIEHLIYEIAGNVEYPYEYVCYKITGYRPEGGVGKPFPGGQLRVDLCKLLGKLSETVSTPAAKQPEPVYTVEEVEKLYSVSTRTVFRWRQKGLVARKYVFNGRKRTGIRKSALEKFVESNGAKIERSSRFSRLHKSEKETIVELAVKYHRGLGLSFSDITERLSQELGRSREAIRYTLRRHDQENPTQRIFPLGLMPLTEHERRRICRDFLAGERMSYLTKKYGRSRSALYRIVNQVRAEQMLTESTDYVHDKSFDKPNADAIILDHDSDEDRGPSQPLPKPAKDLPQYLRRLYETALLTKTQEFHLFRRYNYLKHKIAKLKATVANARPKAETLAAITELQKRVISLKNQLVRANLRLVVSVAKRHIGPLTSLFELISDGNLCLMRAVEKFDFSRGNKFSTYGTWALIKNFARTVPEENYVLNTFVTGTEEVIAGTGDNTVEAADEKESAAAMHHMISSVLSKLSDRERTVIVSRFGIGNDDRPKTLEEVGRIFGLTRERIRQIEARALKKLRAMLAGQAADMGIT